MSGNVYIYIVIMAVVTYLIRMLPLALIRKEIKNTFIKSFLYYVPFVALSVMIFPAILSSTDSFYSAVIGFAVALIAGYLGKSLFTVSLLSVITVFVFELIIF
ncbi:MAG: AzlD domain-containing protein [Clostridia bacterium]|nr:AzlD domain-containing protein [Clostridia bacterium]